MVIEEKGKTTRLHRGDCAFIRKDFSVRMTKQAWNGEQFKAVFLTFTPKFLRGFYNKLEPDSIPKDAKREKVSLCKLPSNRPDIVSLFESMTPYFDSGVQPADELLTENGRRNVCAAQHEQEPVRLGIRLHRPVENRHHGLSGKKLHE